MAEEDASCHGFSLYHIIFDTTAPAVQDIFATRYDLYTAMIVAARSPEAALSVHPDGMHLVDVPEWVKTWAHRPEHFSALRLEFLGSAAPEMISERKRDRENILTQYPDPASEKRCPADVFVIESVFCPG